MENKIYTGDLVSAKVHSHQQTSSIEAQTHQLSQASIHSKTLNTYLELPPNLIPPKKRYKLFFEGWEKLLVSQPQIQKNKNEKTISVNTHDDEVQKVILIMKFPQGATLPSPTELEAKFARFGSLDIPSIHCNWDELSCQIVFKDNSNVVIAYAHAINNRLFGNTDVSYLLCYKKSTCNTQNECCHQEMGRYREQLDQMDQTDVVNNNGGVDFSEKMLYLLHECYCIVKELEPIVGKFGFVNTHR